MICPDYPFPQFLIISSKVPPLLYYSHLPAIFITLLLGFFVYFKNKHSLLSKILLSISITFSLWVFLNLIAWTANDSNILAFVFPFFSVLYAILCILCLYFVYVFIDKKDIIFRTKIIFGALLLPVILLAPSKFSFYKFNIPFCGIVDEGFYFSNYYYGVGFLMFLWIMFLLISRYRKAEKEFKKQKETEQKITDINKELERRMIQEIKKQEKQQQLLAQKSKLESLGTLAAGIAHEINQPLGGISMGLDNILLKTQEDNINKEYLKDKVNLLFENVERIKKIIDHIRYFSRTQKPVSFVQVNINDVIKSALFMVSAQYENHGVIIETNLDESAGMITADKYKLEQVLLNLLSNSKYAIDEKAKRLNDGKFRKRIEIKSYKDSDFVYISLMDNGIGIPNKIIDKIFDPFFTTKSEEKGTGLGLSISYGFIKDILGEIKVESIENEYTVFEISIPKE